MTGPAPQPAFPRVRVSLIARLSLRVRLLLVGLGGVAVALAAGGVALYATLTLSLNRALDTEARSAAAQVVMLVDSGTVPALLPVSGAQIVQIVDEQGRVLAGSSNADRLTALLTPAEVAHGLTGTSQEVPGFRAGLAGPLRVVVVGAGPSDARRAVIVAVFGQDADRGAVVLRTALLIVDPIVLLLLGVIAWLVTARALAPVEQLRAAAERISGGHRDERLPVPPAADEIRSLAITLNDMLARLASARDRQRQFVADAAHELRSPLASIRTQLEVARHLDGADSVAADALLDVARLNRIVGDLLLLARADADADGPTTGEQVDLGDLLVEMADRFPAGLILAPERDRPVTVHTDRDKLARAVGNVIENAARHAESHVELGLGATPVTVLVTVTDDGPGIAATDRARVFERFTRLDDARDRDAGGSGLGLPIAAELLATLGGGITLSDRADGAAGLRVEIRLPRDPQRSASTTNEAAPAIRQ